MQNLSLKEADWRIKQTDTLEKLLKGYREVTTKFFSHFEDTHTKGELSDVETDFLLTLSMVNQAFLKAHTQYGIAINIGDREAAKQAHNYIQTLKNWHDKADLQMYFLEEYFKINALITKPELSYYKDIK